MSKERMTRIAYELQKLGVSQDGTLDILLKYPLDVIEAQVSYMPYRRAKRPDAFIVEAIRKNYSPPNKAFYAKAKAELAASLYPVDPDSQPPLRPTPAESEGYGAEDPARPHSPDLRLEPGWPGSLDALPDFDEADR